MKVLDQCDADENDTQTTNLNKAEIEAKINRYTGTFIRAGCIRKPCKEVWASI